ncbi:unnamed protein product [Boreogadus saida]
MSRYSTLCCPGAGPSQPPPDALQHASLLRWSPRVLSGGESCHSEPLCTQFVLMRAAVLNTILVHTCEDHACEDHACEDHACEDHACEDHACEDHACEDHACEDHACEDHACPSPDMQTDGGWAQWQIGLSANGAGGPQVVVDIINASLPDVKGATQFL